MLRRRKVVLSVLPWAVVVGRYVMFLSPFLSFFATQEGFGVRVGVVVVRGGGKSCCSPERKGSCIVCVGDVFSADSYPRQTQRVQLRPHVPRKAGRRMLALVRAVILMVVMPQPPHSPHPPHLMALALGKEKGPQRRGDVRPMPQARVGRLRNARRKVQLRKSRRIRMTRELGLRMWM